MTRFLRVIANGFGYALGRELLRTLVRGIGMIR